jgi:hypothetical protein
MRSLDSPATWALLARTWAHVDSQGEAAPHTRTVWAVQRLTLGKHSRRRCHTTCRRPPQEGTAHCLGRREEPAARGVREEGDGSKPRTGKHNHSPTLRPRVTCVKERAQRKLGVARQGCLAACSAGTRGAHGHKKRVRVQLIRHHTTLLATTKPKDHGLRSIQCTALTSVRVVQMSHCTVCPLNRQLVVHSSSGDEQQTQPAQSSRESINNRQTHRSGPAPHMDTAMYTGLLQTNRYPHTTHTATYPAICCTGPPHSMHCGVTTRYLGKPTPPD